MSTSLKIQKTAKIATYGNPNSQTIWIVLHGYGQLADYFIRNFHVLDETQNFVIAPEGLHRFYLSGAGGRVGASWMTKEKRDIDIQDYIHYLDQVYDKFDVKKYSKVVLLGFSQGTSTAARWVELGKVKPYMYIQWAGVFPPDLNINQNIYIKSRNFYVVGDEDQYVDQTQIKKELASFKEKNIEVCYIPFKGKHLLDSSIIKLLNDKLDNI